MSQIVKDVEDLLVRWYNALLTGDADNVTLLYSADAILLSTLGQGVHQGHPQIREYFAKGFLPRKPFGATVTPYTRILGGVAVNSGIYKFDLDKKPEEGTGRMEVTARYTFVYQWAGTDWLIVEHHSSVMPTKPKGSATSRSRRKTR